MEGRKKEGREEGRGEEERKGGRELPSCLTPPGKPTHRLAYSQLPSQFLPADQPLPPPPPAAQLASSRHKAARGRGAQAQPSKGEPGLEPHLLAEDLMALGVVHTGGPGAIGQALPVAVVWEKKRELERPVAPLLKSSLSICPSVGLSI